MLRIGIVALVILAACARAQPAAIATPSPAFDKAQACARVCDRAIVVYADAWAETNDVVIAGETERWALHESFRRELARRGSLARFDAQCLTSMTPELYACARGAYTAKALAACAP